MCVAERSEGDSRWGRGRDPSSGDTPFLILHLFSTSQEAVKYLVGAGLSGRLDSGILLHAAGGYVLPLSHTLHPASLRLSANFPLPLSNPIALVKHISLLITGFLTPFPISSQARLPLMDTMVT